MERLTKRVEDKIYYSKGKYPPTTLCAEMETREVRECMQKLAEYEDLEEQGRLVKLPPISEKQTLYWLWGNEIMPVECKGIDTGVVYKMKTQQDRTFTGLFKGNTFTYKKGDIRYFYMRDFGKTVFLTREEAEKALAEEVK